MQNKDNNIKEFFRKDFESFAKINAPTVSINTQSGRILFNGPAAEMMGLKAGMHLAYVEHAASKPEPGFRVTEDKRGFELYARPLKRDKRPVAISCKKLSKHIFDVLGQGHSFRVQIGSEYTGGWWLMPSSVTVTARKR